MVNRYVSYLQIVFDPSGSYILDLSKLHVTHVLNTDVSRVTTPPFYSVYSEENAVNGINVSFFDGFASSGNAYNEVDSYYIVNSNQPVLLIGNGTTLYFAATFHGQARATGAIDYNLSINGTPLVGNGQNLLVNAGEAEWGVLGFFAEGSEKHVGTPFAVTITGNTDINSIATFTAIGAEDIVIDDQTFPDEGIRDLLPEIIGDAGADGILTPEEIAEITEIDLSGKGIDSLAGIENFTALESLDVSDNDLVTLPALPATLTDLDCSGNGLDSLPALPDALTRLDCSNNGLATLPELPPALEYLDCS
ncbi:MAG: hypothetical protein LBK67_05015, partial [Coriobacteriales bacterium]|nr:hypothetical protein [Coriobacteriales bacterium]